MGLNTIYRKLSPQTNHSEIRSGSQYRVSDADTASIMNRIGAPKMHKCICNNFEQNLKKNSALLPDPSCSEMGPSLQRRCQFLSLGFW